MFQPAFDDLAGGGIEHCNLLETSMEITTYNNHCSAPFSRAVVDKRNQVYSAEGSRRPYPIIFQEVHPSSDARYGTPSRGRRLRKTPRSRINCMQRKMFWTAFAVLGLVADLILPFWWALAATIPIGVVSWWVAYRSDWF